ncbi:MAG: ABC transporter ATP-binding protein [Candidatus Omnitrophica bacterium]|nr:ABC transporter ATP-binding protein [Candidatus Omnitrophota bacterium]
MSEKIVEIKNLRYAYPDGKEALRGVNLDIFEGETLGIIGPNGAGKSTLLLHLNGILRGEGFVRIFGLDITGDTLSDIRSGVGLVFQEPDHQLFMPTVFDDVAFGPINMGLDRKQIEDSVKEALKEVDMLDVIHRPSHHLSIGEKKRVAIATILSMHPRLIALDEPSANLDPKHRRDLIYFLKKATLSKIIASHDLELILETCGRVLLLDKGEIIADGLTADMLRNQSLLESHGLEVPHSLLNGYYQCAG